MYMFVMVFSIRTVNIRCKTCGSFVLRIVNGVIISAKLCRCGQDLPCDANLMVVSRLSAEPDNDPCAPFR